MSGMTAVANYRGEHLDCRDCLTAVVHEAHTASADGGITVQWEGEYAGWVDAEGRNSGWLRCDLSEPHPQHAHSNSQLQMIWLNPNEQETEMTTPIPQTRAEKRVQRNQQTSAGGWPISFPSAEPQTTEPPVVLAGGGSSHLSASGPTNGLWPTTWSVARTEPSSAAVAGTPEDLGQRLRHTRETYLDERWHITLTERIDDTGRRLAFDAFLPAGS